MSYLVLARKYRPQTFDEVVGQDHVTTTLRNAIEQGRVHHAFLFSGVRGTGKTTTARILAKALNCEKGPTPTPCNECRSCREISAGTSPDVQEIDGASHTGVDDIRELREAVRYLPTYGRHKVYIIDEVHMLSVSAFNALLKTLEEPPAHVTFIFATTEPQKIPATILSRCQRFDFRRVTVDEIQKHLSHILEEEGISADESSVRTVAIQAGGSVRDALSLLDQIIAYSAGERITDALVDRVLGLADRSVLQNLAESLLEQEPDRVLEIIDDVFRSGWDLVQLMRSLVSYLRDLVVTSVAKNPDRLMSLGPTELEDMKAVARRYPADRLLEVFDAAVRATEDVSRSEFQKLTCEMRLVELAITKPILPFPELLSRLEALETRLQSSGQSGPSLRKTGNQQPTRSTVGVSVGRSQTTRRNARPDRQNVPSTTQRSAETAHKRKPGRTSHAKDLHAEPGASQSEPSSDDDPDPHPAPTKAEGPGELRPEQNGLVLPVEESTKPQVTGPTRKSADAARPHIASPSRQSDTGVDPAMDPADFDPSNLPFSPIDETQMARWEEIVSVVRQRAPFLGATLSLARVVSVEESAGRILVHLAVPPQSLGEDRLDEDAAKKCARLVREELGVDLSLQLGKIDEAANSFIDTLWRKVVQLHQDPAGPRPEQAALASLRPFGLADKQKLDKAKKDAKTKREALEDPMVRKLKDLLDARVRGVKVLD